MMIVELILIVLVLWTISFVSIFKPVAMLRLKDIFRIEGEVKYTDLAKHSVIFGGIVIFLVSLFIIYFYVTEFII